MGMTKNQSPKTTSMHCPSCGKPATSDQQFCRTCGMSLEVVGKLVARHSPQPEVIQKRIARAEAEQIAVRQMFNWITWGMIVFGIGLALLLVNKSFDMGAWIKLISSCLMLGGTGIGAAGVLNSIRNSFRNGTQLAADRHANNEMAEAIESKSLPTNPIPDALPSITEHTTQLISPVDSPRKES